MKFFLKIIFRILLAITVALNLVILCSGRFYIYKALANTYFKGRTMPNVSEYPFFENRKIAATKPQKWLQSKLYNTATLPTETEKLLTDVNAHAFLIVKNDSLIHEQYWDGFSDTSHTNSFSMGKSYTSALLGCAIDDGFIKTIDEPVSAYIPEFKNGWRSKITLKHLVTMSSGIDFDESYISPFAYPAEGYYGNDLYKATVKYDKQRYEPGAVFEYLSGNPTLLGYCITKAVGKPLSTYCSERLWSPIGCEQQAFWSLDKKEGLEKTFCCLNSNARDFIRMGKLYLHQGNWDGKQIIDSNYINQSIVPFNCKETDGSQNTTYGYSWWLTEYKGMRVFYMRGILGQYVICLPEKNMVICKLSRKRRAPGATHTPADVGYCIDAALNMYGE